MENQKENTGVLFKNKEKKTEKHPDYNGYANFNGLKFKISAWSNVSKGGFTYISLALQEDKRKDDNLPF